MFWLKTYLTPIVFNNQSVSHGPQKIQDCYDILYDNTRYDKIWGCQKAGIPKVSLQNLDFLTNN